MDVVEHVLDLGEHLALFQGVLAGYEADVGEQEEGEQGGGTTLAEDEETGNAEDSDEDGEPV